jgi:hypothetical protein
MSMICPDFRGKVAEITSWEDGRVQTKSHKMFFTGGQGTFNIRDITTVYVAIPGKMSLGAICFEGPEDANYHLPITGREWFPQRGKTQFYAFVNPGGLDADELVRALFFAQQIVYQRFGEDRPYFAMDYKRPTGAGGSVDGTLAIYEDRVEIWQFPATEPLKTIPIDRIKHLEVRGSGLSQWEEGGGFVGGGFGVKGALAGYGQATILNALTTSTQTEWDFEVRVHTSEGYRGYPNFTHHPEHVQETLRPLNVRIQAAAEAAKEANANMGRPVPDAVSATDALVHLASLLDKGLLTRDEFDAQKKKLLAPDAAVTATETDEPESSVMNDLQALEALKKAGAVPEDEYRRRKQELIDSI